MRRLPAVRGLKFQRFSFINDALSSKDSVNQFWAKIHCFTIDESIAECFTCKNVMKTISVFYIVAFLIFAVVNTFPETTPCSFAASTGRKHFTDESPALNPAEEMFFRDVAIGTNADYETGSTPENDPTNVMSWTNRVIRADRLVWLCTDHKASGLITYKGIQISNGFIDGELDLKFADIAFPLTIEKSVFSKAIDIEHANIRSICLNGDSIQSLEAHGARVVRMCLLEKWIQGKSKSEFG